MNHYLITPSDTKSTQKITAAELLSARSTKMKQIDNPRTSNWYQRLAHTGMILLATLASVISLPTMAAVSVDQSPLIIQKPVPPNIVLMLDDSGSMGWDAMPDWGYLASTSGAAPVTSAVNGVYYDPTITYLPPVDAVGNSYTNYSGTFPNAPVNGFSPGTPSNYKNITDYSSTYAGFKYYANLPSSDRGSLSCPTGTYQSSIYADYCYWPVRYSYNPSDPNYITTNNGYYYYEKICSLGNDCVTGPVFRYGVETSPGTYVEHYVSPSGCGTASNCVKSTDTSGVAAPPGISAGENIANWFAYYHTRLLMVKTGLTLAFSSLDPAYRFGFGSINGRNTGDIPSPSFGFSTSTKSNNKLAEVKPFGDGTATSQKAKFWTWLIGESANNSTPLRQSLQAVGNYYKTDQPWETSSTDSTKYACRPAFTILTTDGFWNGNNPSGVGDADDQSGVSSGFNSDYTENGISGYKQPNCDPANDPNCKTYVYDAKAPFSKDNSQPSLADVAMYYWKNDLMSGIANEVPTTPSDPAFWQHMTTFTLGLGFDPVYSNGGAVMPIKDIFTWARTGTAPNPPFSNPSAFAWPTPSSGSIKNISDLAHAAVNGHGDFFTAKDPNAFVKGIQSALASIANTPGSNNAITQSGTTLPSTTSSTDPFYQFRATYTTGQWTGTLTESYYDSTLSTPGYVQGWSTDSWSPTFDTTTGLSNRNVWTTKDGTAAQSVAFRKAIDLSPAEIIGLSAYTGTLPQTMLNYLLGDKTYEGTTKTSLRPRKAILGDVVSSTPVYVAAPDKTLYENATFTGASTYQSFVTNNTSRAPIVYAAANDGMLHAFRVTTGAGWDISGATVTPDSAQPAGTEVYAYMPEAVLTQTGTGSITNLANPQYGVVNGVDGTQAVPHQYYNDGRITVQNVYFSSDSSWHTVLVGTTGRGPAKAIYALDITDPSVLMNPATAKNALLWERSAGDSGACTGTITTNCSDYIGEMTGAPVVAQIKQGGVSSWAVFVGNGYNSTANTAALLQFNLQTGALTVHTTDSTANNGLAEPGLMQGDTNTGISTYAFGGDLFGNVWKFDLSSSTSVGSSVFIAKDDTGATQPITALIALDYDSSTNSTFALFGTGKYLSSDDVKSAQVQTWYGIRVGMGANLSGAAVTNTPVVTSASTRSSNLTERYAFDDTSGNRATSLQTAGDMDQKVGWYMDLPVSGERIVNRTQFIAGKAVVTTLIPKVNDPCNTVPQGAVMGVDPFTGANQTTDYGLGTTFITVNHVSVKVAINGKVFSEAPAAGVTANYTADGKVSISFNTMKGGLQTLGPLDLGGGASGRVSWRELVN